MSEPLLRLNGASYQQDGRKILTDIDLSVNSGDILTIIGPNGGGKSVLVKLLLGLLPCSTGKLTQSSKAVVGYMPQSVHRPASLPMTVKRFLSGLGATEEAVFTTAKAVGVTHCLESPIQVLSGGEWQRILLARALLRSPNVLVLDEPTQGVDVQGQADFYQLLKTIHETKGCAMVIVSHDLHVVMQGTDRVICVHGHICCQGKPEAVGAHPSYQALFGDVANQFALYRHHHTHAHQPSAPPDPKAIRDIFGPPAPNDASTPKESQ